MSTTCDRVLTIFAKIDGVEVDERGNGRGKAGQLIVTQSESLQTMAVKQLTWQLTQLSGRNSFNPTTLSISLTLSNVSYIIIVSPCTHIRPFPSLSQHLATLCYWVFWSHFVFTRQQLQQQTVQIMP